MTEKELLQKAAAAAQNAYAPYSKFKIGCAVLCSDGRVFSGCNVENASYGGAICAERTAMVKAISEGSRAFVRLAVYSDDVMPYPCGICRQFLAEFAVPDTEVVVAKGDAVERYTAAELLPYTFGGK